MTGSHGGVLTLPQIADRLGAPYRTLHSWVERGLISPSVHRAAGTGRTNLYSEADARRIAWLHRLWSLGLGFDALVLADSDPDTLVRALGREDPSDG